MSAGRPEYRRIQAGDASPLRTGLPGFIAVPQATDVLHVLIVFSGHVNSQTTGGLVMAKVLVLYYSMYGHIEIMANAVAEGVRSIENAEAVVKRVPELMSEEAARRVGAKLDQVAPIATVDELPTYDAIIFGTPTRFGNMCA